ncbi:MAG: polyketide synthase of type I, partial [Sphingobacteriales bacterium]
VLASDFENFLPIDDSDRFENSRGSHKAIIDIQQLLLNSDIPVIAALSENAKNSAWIIGLFCDASVYNEKGSYAISNVSQSSEFSKSVAVIVPLRLGNFGKQILLSAAEYSGLALMQQVKTLKVVKKEQVLPAALKLADAWAKLPLASVQEWKHSQSLTIREKINLLPSLPDFKEHQTPSSIKSSMVVALKSSVIRATAHPEGILEITMEDREAKNMFSDAFVEGINEVFDHIEKTQGYKVIILSGYDNYFASGGTKEGLLSIQEGRGKFTDIKVYQLPLQCKLPVIAAMQGHGIGAGWALGMFADITLFSEESRYISPYMNYGFTPGAGSTFIFPEKIGYDLARETLLTAQEYSGSALGARGLSHSVLPRKQVAATAMELAKQIATNSRNNLIAIKQQFNQQFNEPLSQTYELELAMHEQTFVGQSETLKQIESNFHMVDASSSRS